MLIYLIWKTKLQGQGSQKRIAAKIMNHYNWRQAAALKA